MRIVFTGKRKLPELATHPAASLGRAFHRLLEMSVRGEVSRRGTAEEDAARTLDELISAEEGRLASEGQYEVSLKSVMSPLTWRRKRRAVLNLAEKYLLGAVPLANRGPGGRSISNLHQKGRWAEVHLEVPELRLAGRVDLLERDEHHVIIRDLKTGRVAGRDGVLRPEIELQMHLYGLMARRLWPEASVRLIVDHGVEENIDFGPSQEASAQEWLTTILTRLSPESRVSTGSLANVGPGCETCRHRHVCPAYLSSAPNLWPLTAPVRLPLDVWGEVVSLERTGSSLNVSLKDAGGRAAKVFGVAFVRASELVVGEMAYFFSLGSRDRRGGPDSWVHPHNFFEVSDDYPPKRALSLEIFMS